MPAPMTRQLSASTTLTSVKNRYKFDHLGDSRTANLHVGGQLGVGLGGSHWFNVANTLLGKRMRLGLNRGVSGFRTDEYIAAGLADILASDAGWAVFGFPFVNNLVPNNNGVAATFPFTNLKGVTVTAANVGEVAAQDVIEAATLVLARGKNVIICEEPGAAGLTPDQIRQLFAGNRKLKAWALRTPGVYFFSANSVLWNPTGSATAITFRVGYSADGTHNTALGGYAAGKAFAAFIAPMLPWADSGPSLLLDTTANNPFQLGRNPLFNTSTGGASSNLTLASGAVPAGWSLSASAAGLVTADIASPADPNGFGKGVQMTLTATGACTMAFECNAPANADYDLTDLFSAGIDADVAAGSSNFAVFWQTQLATNNGTLDLWDMYPIGFGNGPTEAYSYRLRGPDSGVKAGATAKTYIAARARMQFTAAGSAVVTFRRPTFERLAA